MRNLKKFLALFLAMMMALSLMVTVNATNTAQEFPDAEDVIEEFQEDVDVLTGMGVIKGHADTGTFAPKVNVTRAQMAAIVYRLATGDASDARSDLYKEYQKFSDVKSDAWYAGYVGYCADAGYIQGYPNGTFKPNDPVTGYAALAMVLRAMGYNQPGNNFTGSTWKAETGSIATQRGMLVNINKSIYAGTLNNSAPRELVAEIAFQAANPDHPMVQWTNAFGYQTTGLRWDNTNGNNSVTTGIQNPSLGEMYYGLTCAVGGVVIGNQETGETATRLGYSGSATKTAENLDLMNPYYFDEYTYEGLYWVNVPVPAGGAQNAAVRLGNNTRYNISTGIDLMGHEVTVWYDQTTSTSKGFKTYAYFDEAELAEVVKVVHPTGTTETAANEKTITDMTDTVTGGTSLYSAMKAAGFTVNGNTSAYLNNSFGKFSLERFSEFDSTSDDLYTPAAFAAGTYSGGTAVDVEESPEHLYMVVSNNPAKMPDAVISLNLQTSNVTGVDNVNTIKTVTVPYAMGTSTMIDGNDNWDFINYNNVLTTTAQGAAVSGGTLEQGQLVGNSAKTLGQKEVGLHITGTVPYDPDREGTQNAANGNATAYDKNWFKLNPITEIKDGVVVAYTNNTVTLQDGTVLTKSIVYDTVVAGTIRQVQTSASDNTPYEHTNYRFYITKDNKYVGAERVYGTEFIYGTYMDYSQELSSSAFKYYLTGVTLDGETTTVPVSALATTNNAAATPINATNILGVPYRDTSATGVAGQFVNGIGTGVYRGFAYGSDVANWTFAGLNDIRIVAGANGSARDSTTASTVVDNTNAAVAPATVNTLPSVVFDGTDGAGGANDPVTIGSTEVTLGATYAGTLDVDGTGGAGSPDKLYFTENTKFILVSGYGTDSLKTQVFNGISDLKGDSDSVAIDFARTAATMRLLSILATATAGDMTYFTQSPFIYAQNQVLSRQADTIILPAAAVSRTSARTIRYVGNATPTLVNSNAVLGQQATRFTMYNDGVAENVWIQGLVNNAATANTAGSTNRNSATLVAFGNIQNNANRYHDHFWNLVDTGLKANDGEPIYNVTPVVGVDVAGYPDALPTQVQNVYVASTYSAQTGSFTQDATIMGAAGTPRMLNVASANITNLNTQNPNCVWPGISNLTTLNEAGSLGIYTTPQYGGTQTLKVSFLTAGPNAPDNLNVTQIYVCYAQ